MSDRCQHAGMFDMSFSSDLVECLECGEKLTPTEFERVKQQRRAALAIDAPASRP
jgi:hypothetical protein